MNGVLARSLRRTLIALGFFIPVAAQTQDSLRTRAILVSVFDSASRQGIYGASVSLGRGSASMVLTDSAGRASLRIPSGRSDTLRISAQGYRQFRRAIDRTAEDVIMFEVLLAPAVQVLANREVRERGGATPEEGRLSEYKRRLASGRGRFITRKQIDDRSSVRISELFRGIAGLRVIDSASSKLILASRPGQASLVSTSANSDCVVPVAVDGLLQDGSFQVDLLTPQEVEGIEIFIGIGTIPPAYSSMQRNAWCGLILIWTRDR